MKKTVIVIIAAVAVFAAALTAVILLKNRSDSPPRSDEASGTVSADSASAYTRPLALVEKKKFLITS